MTDNRTLVTADHILEALLSMAQYRVRSSKPLPTEYIIRHGAGLSAEHVQHVRDAVDENLTGLGVAIRTEAVDGRENDWWEIDATK